MNTLISERKGGHTVRERNLDTLVVFYVSVWFIRVTVAVIKIEHILQPFSD